MTICELIEKRNKLLADARQIMTNSDVSAEQRSKVDAMLTEANGLKADIERMEACAETEERSIPRNAPPRGAVESGTEDRADNRSYDERRDATNIALRAYLRGERFEQRDLTVASDGAVMLPVAALPPVSAQRSAGSIYDIVNHLPTTSGEDIRLPLWDDTSNLAVLDSTAVGNGTDPTTSGVTLKVDGLRLGDPLLIDNKLIQDVSYDLVGYVNKTLAKRYTLSMAKFINLGNSSNFAGLSGNIPTPVTTGTADAIGYDDIVALIASLDPAYALNACFAFSNTVLGSILKIKDDDSRPLFLPFLDGAKSGFAGSILGYPVKLNSFGGSIADNKVPVMFGDFAEGYTVREVKPGVVLKQSNQRWIETNKTGIVGFARAGGHYTLANDTTYSPIVGLKVKAAA